MKKQIFLIYIWFQLLIYYFIEHCLKPVWLNQFNNFLSQSFIYFELWFHCITKATLQELWWYWLYNSSC